MRSAPSIVVPTVICPDFAAFFIRSRILAIASPTGDDTGAAVLLIFFFGASAILSSVYFVAQQIFQFRTTLNITNPRNTSMIHLSTRTIAYFMIVGGFAVRHFPELSGNPYRVA